MPKVARLIVIAGGTCSGKTYLARSLAQKLPSGAAVVSEDSYYRVTPAAGCREFGNENFDRPDSIDGGLLIEHLQDLLSGKTVVAPQYDKKLHTRTGTGEVIEPCKVVVLEGQFVLGRAEVRELADFTVYLDVAADVRLARRLVRDVEVYGLRLSSAIHYFMTVHRPMYLELVEPTRRYADLVQEWNLYAGQPAEELVARVLDFWGPAVTSGA